jgi:hypothetical protein
MLTWNRIQSLYEPISDRHARAAQPAGLSCPSAVFIALFHGRHDDPDLQWLLRGIDFSQVTWEQEDRSGVSLRQVSVDRAFQEAVDEAYRDIIDNDLIHEREDVVASRRETGTWIEPPILLSGAVLGSAIRDYLLLGSTQLGCLLAFLKQAVVTEKFLRHSGRRPIVFSSRRAPLNGSTSKRQDQSSGRLRLRRYRGPERCACTSPNIRQNRRG